MDSLTRTVEAVECADSFAARHGWIPWVRAVIKTLSSQIATYGSLFEPLLKAGPTV